MCAAQLTQSALIQACIGCGALKRARQLYGAMQEQGRAPSLPALNNLINAHARACRLGDVVSLVQDLVAGGMKPDGFTFAAVLNACQRANEAELAFEVYRYAALPVSRLCNPQSPTDRDNASTSGLSASHLCIT